MQYVNTVRGFFLARPNRFIARVEIGGREETVHVMNTGRCRELLIPGAPVVLSVSDNPARKTKYDLVTVYKSRAGLPPLAVNLDSSAPNAAAAEWLPVSGLFSSAAQVRREVRRGDSRFDFMIEDGGRVTWLEVKGVTLEENGIARFPDAPTERGLRHLRHLTEIVRAGGDAAVLFVLQMQGMRAFTPNDGTHRAFGDALREAEAAGVRIIARECAVTDGSITITDAVPVYTTGGIL